MLAEAVTKQLQQYLELGLNPIPLKGKVAQYRWKEFELTEVLMRKGVKAGVNWGIRAGFVSSGVYLYFIDLDSKTTISEFMKANNLPSAAPLISSGRGFHWWLAWTREVRTHHLEGLDLIGNGYVVVPPSIHASGKPYRFIRPLGDHIPMLDPESIVLPVRQETLKIPLIRPDSLAKHTKGQAAFDWDDVYKGVGEGSRHNVLIRYLGILFARWHTQVEALSKALEWNDLNKPPLSIFEVEGTVKAAWTEWDKRREDLYED